MIAAEQGEAKWIVVQARDEWAVRLGPNGGYYGGTTDSGWPRKTWLMRSTAQIKADELNRPVKVNKR